MIDHLLKFSGEAEAISAVRQHYISSDAQWRTDYCIPGATVYSVAADGKKTADGSWYLWIALPTKDAQLIALPQCIMVLDRDAAAQAQAFIAATTLDAQTLSTLFVQPVNAGTQYLKSVGKQDILKDPTVEPTKVDGTATPAQLDAPIGK